MLLNPFTTRSSFLPVLARLGLVLVLLAAAWGVLPALQFAYADTGGPDAYGYTYTDSTEPDGPTYNFEDISGTGTRVPNSSGAGFLDDQDDNVSEAIPIGFTFNYCTCCLDACPTKAHRTLFMPGLLVSKAAPVSCAAL